jgi:hypothetical protein
MAEETRWCRICRKEKPNDAFRAPEGAGKDFYKMCEPCRTKYRNVRIPLVQMDKRVRSRIGSRLKGHRDRELKGRTQTGDELGRIIFPSQHPKLASTSPTQRRELPRKPPVPHKLPPCLSNRTVCTQILATTVESQLHRPLSKVLRKAQQLPLSSPSQPPLSLRM